MHPNAGVSAKRGSLLLLLAILLVAANLRAPITGIGPLLDEIGRDLVLSPSALGALGAMPVATWAFVSPLAHTLSARWGFAQVITGALIVLAAGTVIRSLPGSAVSLWVGTAIIGAAIAIGNVLIPAVIKTAFPHVVPTLMAVFSAVLSSFGALASGLVVPISLWSAGGDDSGWRAALLATGCLAPIALIIWWLTGARQPVLRTTARHLGRTGIWGDGLAWLVALYMGSQSAAFYILLTWLAPYAIAYGRSPAAAGVDVMVFQLVGIAGSFIAPVLLRSRVRRWAPAASPWLGIAGGVGLLLAPDLLLLWAVVMGLSGGASLSMALTIIAQRSADNFAASALSGMSQSVGYAIAALGPVAFGALLGLTGSFLIPLLVLLGTLVLQSLVGISVGRERFVLGGVIHGG